MKHRASIETKAMAAAGKAAALFLWGALMSCSAVAFWSGCEQIASESIDCASDSECAEGQNCAKTAECLRTGCENDYECPTGWICEAQTGACSPSLVPVDKPDWGFSFTFDDPVFPEDQAENGGASGGENNGDGGGSSPRGPASSVPPKIEEANEVCVDEHTQVVLYMSADDSNSKASAVIARKLINEGYAVPDALVRTYEFLNYYSILYAAAERGDIRIVPQMVASENVPGIYMLQIGVQAPHVGNAERRHLNLTFSLDNSGSMTGSPIENQKEVLRAIAENLKEGDVVSMVSWDTVQNTIMDSHIISGPNDSVFLEAIDGLNADGSTDLNSGLRKSYELARKNYSEEYLNRVIVISDGQANVGVTEVDLIAEAAEDNEKEAIYLVGVGTGVGYNDKLMDGITDAGKGGYLFIDTPDEARRQFTGDLFVANLDIAAMNVRLRLKLPPTFRVVEFHGEEMSGDPAEVKPQHLAPNTAMIYHQGIGSCTEEPFRDDDVLEVEVEFKDPATREERVKEIQATGAELLGNGADGSDRPQLVKGNAVVTYAEALKKLYRAEQSEAGTICELAQTIVGTCSRILPDDWDLREIDELLDTYCERCMNQGCGQDLWGDNENADGDDDDNSQIGGDDDSSSDYDSAQGSGGCGCTAAKEPFGSASIFKMIFSDLIDL